jgi:hypothetical protein
MKYLKTYEGIAKYKTGDYIIVNNYKETLRVAFTPDDGDNYVVAVSCNKEFKVKNSVEIPLDKIVRKLTDKEAELFLSTNKYNL